MKSEFKNLPSGWKAVRLKEISSRITRKNQDNKCQNVLTISAQSGLISQTDFFNKQVASKDLSSYILLRKGDFAYNKSYSTGYSFGAFKRLKFYDEGVASPLYIYFKFNDDICSDFFEFYFDGGQANRQIKDIVQEGARNHGLLNLSIDDFFNIKIYTPPLDEQKKIAEILSTWDEAINLTINLIENKKQFKKTLMQNLLTAKIRFPEFKDKWQETKLNKIFKEHKIKSDNKSEVFSVSVHKGVVNQIEHLGRSFSAKDTSNYNLVKPFDLVYTKSPTGDFPFGIIKQNLNYFSVIVSPLYGVFEPVNKFLGTLLHYFFESSVRTNNYLQPIIQKGAKNTINISNDTFLSRSILMPINLNEQQKIAEVLTACDDEINLLNLKLENLKKQKQGLMQKLLSGKLKTKVKGGENVKMDG